MLNTFRADNIKPVQRFFKTPPVWIKQMVVGNLHPDGKLFTNFKVWMHEPTLNFPSVGLFIGAANGKGSTFSRLANPDELRSLGNFLVACADQAAPVYQGLVGKAEVIVKQLQGLEQTLRTKELVERMTGVRMTPDDVEEDDGPQLGDLDPTEVAQLIAKTGATPPVVTKGVVDGSVG